MAVATNVKPGLPKGQPLQPPIPPDAPSHMQQPSHDAPPTAAKPKLETKRTVTLDYPVHFAGFDYHELTVRRLKAKDFRQLDNLPEGANAAGIVMTALACGVDEAVIDEVDASDYMRLQAVINDFFPQGLGGKPPATA